MHIGRVEVVPEMLLEWLKFEGGVIQGCGVNENGTVCFDIEHPEMPEVKEGGSVPTVTLVYYKEINCQTNKIVSLIFEK